jgi:hypothetical protein
MVKESQYHNDYPNWGKVPRAINLNPGLAKTIADNMPFFGKPTNVNYGGFAGDPDMGGYVDAFVKPKDQQNPLGVDMPLLAETAANDHYKPFVVGKRGAGGDLAPPTLKKIDTNYPVFSNQYQSHYKHDFGNQDRLSPARTGGQDQGYDDEPLNLGGYVIDDEF